ncbi:MAG: M4 family metallopeptidase [Prevotella sp.]|nr:M4 family metallopeptidase [Prevotella sp.]
MKRITLLFVSLLVVVVLMAADKNGRFFLRFSGQRIAVENAVDHFSQWFSLPPGTEWREVSRATDPAGMERIVYHQYVDGVEVEHSQVILHARNGLLRSANGMVMEARRSPAKLRGQSDSTHQTTDGRKLLLVSTRQGYRYAYKVFSSQKNEWVYYDAETGQIIKRVAVLHHFDVPTGTSTTVTGRSFYNDDVTLDVVKGDDGITYLYDKDRNIHTLNGAYLKTYEQMADEGILYDYFPQGNLPGNYNDATEEEKNEWMEMIEEMGTTNQLSGLERYIRDFSSYISSPDGHFSAFKINTLGVSKVTVPDEGGNLMPIDMESEMVPSLRLSLRYGTDVENISNGVLEDMEMPLEELSTPLDISSLSEIIPKEGMTIVVALGEPEDDGDDDDDDDDFYAMKSARAYDDGEFDEDEDMETLDLLAITSFVPDESGKFEFENERIAFTLTYLPAGDPTVDVHWGMGKTLDFYDEVFHRKSYDGNGAPVYNLIYMNNDETACLLANPTTNAGALGTQAPYPMIYGIGGVDYAAMNPVVEISVMAHEFTHIVTGVTANLEYSGESGALNESFSDIMGISVKKYVNHSANWFIGENVLVENSNMRDMADPKNSMDGTSPSPDTYGGEYWVDPDDDGDGDNGGVHTNSSVQNKWYYLLTEGGSGTNDKGYGYDVNGVGIEKSRQIAYLTLTSYAAEQTDYAAISEASIEAAGVLYGDNGQEVNAVVDAWKAVGVLDPDYSTGIHTFYADENDVDCYYDLQGRKLYAKPGVKGVYIHKGGKMVVR